MPELEIYLDPDGTWMLMQWDSQYRDAGSIIRTDLIREDLVSWANQFALFAKLKPLVSKPSLVCSREDRS